MSPQQKTGVLAVTIVGGLFLVAAAGVGAVVMANRSDTTSGGPVGSLAGKPRADREGQDWTLRELLAYLKSQGLYINPTGGADEIGASTGYYRQELHDEQRYVWWVYQHRDAKSARDAAGAKGWYCWGRFMFSTSQEHVEQIRRALGA